MDELNRYSETILICGEECPYDPERKVALVRCENCSNQEEVDVVAVENGKGVVYGFMCSQCGHFNQPCE